jgi:hypothetical protein
MRGCTHAILDDDIKECYIPKESEDKRWSIEIKDWQGCIGK